METSEIAFQIICNLSSRSCLVPVMVEVKMRLVDCLLAPMMEAVDNNLVMRELLAFLEEMHRMVQS